MSYLEKHETYGVEHVKNGEYQRFIPTKKLFGVVTVSKRPAQNFLDVRFADIPLTDVRPILARIKNLFDTDHNPAHLPSTKLKPNGIRVPGSFDPFETAVAIIVGQVVSTEHAKMFLKLVQKYGRKIGQHDDTDVFQVPPRRTRRWQACAPETVLSDQNQGGRFARSRARCKAAISISSLTPIFRRFAKNYWRSKASGLGPRR